MERLDKVPNTYYIIIPYFMDPVSVSTSSTNYSLTIGTTILILFLIIITHWKDLRLGISRSNTLWPIVVVLAILFMVITVLIYLFCRLSTRFTVELLESYLKRSPTVGRHRSPLPRYPGVWPYLTHTHVFVPTQVVTEYPGPLLGSTGYPRLLFVYTHGPKESGADGHTGGGDGNESVIDRT